MVVYLAVTDTTRPISHPLAVPSQATPQTGMAPVLSRAGVPRSLTIRLPPAMQVDQAYALWVRTPDNEWSDPVFINDARPLWFSPSFVHASAVQDAAGRELKVIGRNLQPAPGAVTMVQLVGPEVVTGTAVVDTPGATSLARYAARLKLPRHLTPGRYRVRLSRDGVGWIDVAGQQLEVGDDPFAPQQFAVSDPKFGHCLADDGADDTPCIVNAIAAAQRAGGGVVTFGPGTWDLLSGIAQDGFSPSEGILVRNGVALRGSGSGATRIVRHASWNARAPTPAFTLLGHNEVSGFRFQDSRLYAATDEGGAFLQLGQHWSHGSATVDEVLIARNIFDRTFVAIGDGGLPIHRLVVIGNEFGAYFEALRLTGDRNNVMIPFLIDDSIVVDNVFKPGSRLDAVRQTGTIASELGASSRVDFSGNVADGASRDYLYDEEDPRGWEAGFFWNLNGRSEQILVSRNRASCTGDRTNNGEAIAFDNNGNTFGSDLIAAVTGASATRVTGSLALRARQNSREISRDSFYVGHWIQVVSGPGLGQVRRITAYTVDALTGIATFTVAPAWDVMPAVGTSRFAVGREFWQVYVVDNEIDHRQPLCQKSNRKRMAGGSISAWAQMADSVIEGNRQYDTDGIHAQQAYILPEHPCPDCSMEGFFQYFLDIRGNTVDGEYAWNTDCSASGIILGLAAAPWNDADPPTVGFGNSISHNRVNHADGAQGGAIGAAASWFGGPPPSRWPLSDTLLIHHNVISNIDGPRARAVCAASPARIGISLPASAIAWRSVLYENSCTHVSVPMQGKGVDTVRSCPSALKDSCECPAAP